MNNFIKKMKSLCLRKVNSDATGYVQPVQTIQTNLYTNCYREIRKYRRHISFLITPIILSSLIACGGGGGDATTALTSPANIDATSLGFTSLRVTWDNMPQAERYEVYDSNGVKIATVIPPATNYDATGLSPNTEYTYSIKACNSASCSAPVTSTATTNGNKNGGNTIISSVAELNAIRADSSTLAGNYILTADIDLSSIENWQPIGGSTNRFTGSFDGSGNEISGMTISGNEYAGLFGYVHGASISNLGVRVNNINASSSHAYAGGLAAHANSSLISNVYVIVAKNITSSAAYSSYAGGLFGRVDESRISNSYVVVYGSINSYVSDSSNSYAEGLVGYAHSSLISNSYYSARRVTLQGGFTDITGTYGVAKTVEQLQALNATNTDWDSETWNFGTKNDLPKLSSEFVPNVEPPPVTAPASPGGVTVTPLSSTSMRVSWNSVSDVKSYRLYDNRGGAVINIAPPATSYNARDLLPNTGYTYRVAACNESGCSIFTRGSATTLPASVTPPNPVTSPAVPDSPSSIRAGSLSLTATSITWDSVDGATSYQVYNNDKLVTTINHPATTSYTVTNLSPNTVYTYSVKACNDSGCSASIEVTFVTTSIGVSGAPQVSVVTSTIGQAMPSLNVSWGRIRGVTSYQIFDAAGDKIATVPVPTINYVAEDLSADTLYEHKVRGCYTSSVPASTPGSSEVCGDFSEVGSATTPPVAIPSVPASPSSIRTGSLNLTATSISWDRVDAATSYQVHNNDKLVTTINHPATTSYTVTNLSPNTVYTYSVKACNDSGCSDSIEVTFVTAPIGVSGAPQVSVVTSTIGQAMPSLNVSWGRIRGVTSYQIFDAAGNNIVNVSVPNTSHIIADLSADTLYEYKVRGCYTSSVPASSPRSSEACGDLSEVGSTTTPPVAIPAVPAIPSSISSGSLSLTATSISWDRVDAAEYYEVHNGDKLVTTINHPATTSYTVTNLSPNTVYTYSVKACNDSGCSASIEVTFVTAPIGVSGAPQVTAVASTIGQAMPSLNVSWGRIRGVTSYQIFDGDENNIVNVSVPNTSHIIADLSADTLYEYKVRGCYVSSVPASSPRSSEACGDFSEVGSTTTPPVAIPAVPAIPSSISSGSLSLTATSISWNRVDTAEYYEVHNNDKLVTTINHPATTSYTVTNLSPNTVYTYSVKACNDSGCSDSIEVTFVTAPIGVSGAPQVSVVTSTIGQAMPSLNVSWGRIRGVTSYQIFDAAGNNIVNVSVPNTSHIIADLSADTLYEYKVRGCYTSSVPASSPRSSEACGDLSEVGSTTTPPVAIPAVPAIPSSISSGSLSLTATSISWDRVDGATSYQVHNNDKLVTTINHPATTSYTVTNLSPNTVYTYSVKACNDSGCSASIEVTFVTAPIGVSGAPQVTVVDSTIGQAMPSLNVSWGRIRGVTSYQIFDGDENNIVNVSVPNTSHIIADLSADTLYEYKVRGCYVSSVPASSPRSSEACGDFSEVGSTTTPPVAIPAVPAIPSSISSGSLSLTATSISWNRVDTAEYYEVHNNDKLVTTINHPATTSYTVTNLSPNTVYTYSVKACNDAGCSDSIEVTFVTAPIGVSGAPQVSVVTSTIGQAMPSLNVSWGRIRGVTSYQIFDAAGNNIVNVPIPNTSHIIADLSADTLYEYKVRGCYVSSVPASTSGSSEACGDFSEVGSATTTPVAIPATPSNVVATSLFNSIRISWDSVEGANRYEVHNNGELVTTINNPATTTYTATDLLPTTKYTYEVKACNISGCSDFASVSAITRDTSISSAADLAAIRTNDATLAGNYSITGNIDLSGISNWQPIGDATNKFTGSFDGNGYNISGVSSSDYEYAGLFGYVQNANISNLGVLVGNISSSDSDSYSGGLVGRASNSWISNSYALVTGSISSSSSSSSYDDSSSGGLVGYASNSPISNSYALVEGSISSTSTSSSLISSYSGGLVGSASNSPISNSYALVGGSISSSLSSLSSSGGLVGWAIRSPISNSYALVGGSISSSSSSGGLVGFAYSSPINNSYYRASRKSSEGGFTNSLGIATTLSGLRELTAEDTGWDGDIWDFGTDANPPTLRSLPSPVVTRSLASPEYVTATASGLTSISISWGSVDGAASYEVHNSEGLVSSIGYPTTSYGVIDIDLLPNTEYTYSVRACYLFSCSDFASASAITMIVRISSAAELAAIRSNRATLAGDYNLTGNIDLSQIPNWQPIGNGTNAFTGSFDGNGYNISGVSSSGYQYAGLFGYVENANISNVGVLVGNISSSSPSYSNSGSHSGGLVGEASSSRISNSYALVGGSISSSSSSSSSYYNFESHSGGLVGSARSSRISNSYALVGGSISSSSSSSSTLSSFSSYSHSGGLVGSARSSPISNSYALVGGSISSSSSSSSPSIYSHSGGLVGSARYSPISNSYALVGGSISSLSSTSTSSSIISSYSGGLVGEAFRGSPISNSYALVGGSISSSSYSGGLVGSADGSEISNSYALVGGSISSSLYSGGLVGSAYNNSPISNSYALVGGSISSSLYSGGLVGEAVRSPISNSYALVGGSISSSSSGGLVGTAFRSSPISNSYYRALRKSSEGEFSNTLGTATTLSGLLELNAGTTGWDASVWDFGTDANPPTLRSLPSPAVTRSLASLEYVTVTASGLTAISISWGSVDGAASYEVHNSSGLVASIGHPTTSYGVIDLLPNKEYTYSVRACYLFSCSDFTSASAITMIVRISSAADLAAIRSNRATLAGDYNLTGNIDLSDISNWQPIGDEANRFTGSFAGNGYNISGISSSGYRFAGLFGYVENANISNVGVLVGNISSSSLYSHSYSGGLVGYADNSPISNSYAVVEGSISSSSSSSSFNNDDSYSGGLVGRAGGSPISNSYAVVEGSISSSSSSSSSGSSFSYSGGLVGEAVRSPISNSYALVEDSISSSSYWSYSGGLVGRASSSEISNSYVVVTGNISSSSSSRSLSYSGGLVGYASGSPISNSYAVVTGNISSSSSDDSYSGGLVGGASSSEISNSYAVVTGNISSSSSRTSNSGGLVGEASSSEISNSYAVVEGSISSSSSGDSYSGGLVGEASSSEISNSYAVVGGSISSSTSSSSTYSYSGGLVGYADESPINNSYAVVGGSISSSSDDASYSGGLVGRVEEGSDISNSYYRASRKSSEGGFTNTLGTATTLNGLRELNAGTTGWDTSIWDFGTDANPPTLRSLPSPAVTRSLASPEYVTATASGLSTIGISWGSVDGAASYEVHNSEGLVASIGYPATSYAATDLLPNKEYTYSVRACYLFSCSDFVSATAMTPVAIPATPSNVAATSFGFTSISISWDSVDGADNYEVHNNGEPVATIEAPATTYTATNLLPATEYTYEVKACNTSGCSDFVSVSAITRDTSISSAAELAAIRTNDATLAGNYSITGNIDLSDIPNWQPIGNGTNKFTGSFDGNGYNISGVSSSGYEYAGLFGYVENANISNVGVLVGNISSSSSSSSESKSYSGGLVGYASSSPISNSYAVVEGSISSSSSSSSSRLSSSYSGGLVGVASFSEISNSYAVVEGNISSSSSSDSNSYSGGLVGFAYNNSPISNSYAVVEGSISSSGGNSYSGGLVGWADESPISNSYAVVEGSISSSSFFANAGGLVGWADESPISNSYAVVEGSISSSSSRSDSSSGGLVGVASFSEISNSYALVGGSISSTSSSSSSSSYSGGLVGYAHSSSISNSYAVVGGSISSTSSYETYSGGLVGYAHSSPISNSYAVVEGSISSSSPSSRSYSGGLVGYAYTSEISNSYTLVGGSISSSSRFSYSGGLVGWALSSQISNSYSLVGGSISSSSSSSSSISYSGGLVGWAGSSEISNSYAVVGGSVSSSSSSIDDSYSGGLVGVADDDSPISNSYYSASRESSEGEFSNSHGTSETLSGLRGLNAGATGWSAVIWDFGSDNDLPMLFDNPLTVLLPLVFRE